VIDIPAGKALVAVKLNPQALGCDECVFGKEILKDGICYKRYLHIACTPKERKDKKDVVFKLVDAPRTGRGAQA
jgi:hypothetical protein